APLSVVNTTMVIAIEFDHAVRINAEAGLAFRCRFEMRPNVHPRWVEIAKPRRVGLAIAVDKIERGGEKLLVHCFPPLGLERARIFDGLLANPSILRINSRIIYLRRFRPEYTTRSELCAKPRVLRVIRILRLFLRIEVIEVAKELVEAMHGRQKFVSVT